MPWQVPNWSGGRCVHMCLYIHSTSILLLHASLKETMENAKYFGLSFVIILIESVLVRFLRKM